MYINRCMKLFRLRSTTCKSFAKINLSLYVNGKRDDGYHLLDTIILPTTIHDVIEVSLNEYAKNTTVVCDLPLLQKNHHNLCQRAVDVMRKHYGFKEHFEIKIHKVIPVAAGMGGGSSNAACVLKAINKLLKLGATDDELRKIAIELGTDVPFFIDPQPVRATGIGEILEPISMAHSYYILLIAPAKGLITKEVFAAYDKIGSEGGNSDQLIKDLTEGNDQNLINDINNDLYASALSLYPELKNDIEMVKGLGAEIVSMTGSGSAFFALSKDKKAIMNAELILMEKGYKVYSGKVGCIKDFKKTK